MHQSRGASVFHRNCAGTRQHFGDGRWDGRPQEHFATVGWFKDPGRASMDALHACPAHGMKGGRSRLRTHTSGDDGVDPWRAAAWHTPGLPGTDGTDRDIQEHAFRQCHNRINRVLPGVSLAHASRGTRQLRQSRRGRWHRQQIDGNPAPQLIAPS